jgi:hypothetical protein
MHEVSNRFFQVFDVNTIREIETPAAASEEARWIIKQEYFYPCGSYSYSDFFLINRSGEKVAACLADAEIGEILVRGTAASYILSIELKDKSGSSFKYRLYDDIRYGYGPIIGPKAFSPHYMEWDHSNPVLEIVYYLYELEELGLKRFDELFTQAAELRECKRKYTRLKRDHDLAQDVSWHVESIELREGTKKLTPYAIEPYTHLKTLILPSSVEVIEEFSLCSSNLKEIHCKALVPPVMKFFAFGENRAYPELRIYVPKGTAEEYAKSWGFNGKPIKEFTFIEYYEENI